MIKKNWRLIVQLTLILIIGIAFGFYIDSVIHLYNKSFWDVDKLSIRGFNELVFRNKELLIETISSIVISVIGILCILTVKGWKAKLAIAITSMFIFITIFLTGYVFLNSSEILFWLTFWIAFALTLLLIILYVFQMTKQKEH